MTVFATATPPGEGGIAVVRVSGRDTHRLVARLAGDVPAPRYAALRTFRDGRNQPIDTGLVLWFPGPGSYTGEDMAELQIHGSPVVVALLEEALRHLGGRPAAPGEFTQRAFLNGRMDLTQAEAVAHLIHADSETAARGALNALGGAPRQRLEAISGDLLRLRAELEAELDFPDEEDVPRLDPQVLADRLDGLLTRLEEETTLGRGGHQLQGTARLAVVGAANAGKSSLVNALAGEDVAIVHGEAGTTRDVVRTGVLLGGRRAELLDTAGIRDERDAGVVEREGHRRALDAVDRAGHIVLVIDESQDGEARGRPEWLQNREPGACTVVLNKIDRTGTRSGLRAEGPPCVIGVSTWTGEGLDALRERLDRIQSSNAPEGAWAASLRHLDHLERAVEAIGRARRRVASDPELLCGDLRRAHEELGALTGQVTREDVLGEIFAGFCIGK